MPERTIVITGASDGIGASAARTFARQGERVVVVGRSAEKTEAVANEIGADFFVSDFADLAQVRTLAAQLKEKYPRIDVLANNAGGIMGPRELTVDGHEKTFQVNHLAPFLLTTELIDVLTASQATVINTSSVANSLFGKLDIDDLDAATELLHQPRLRQRQTRQHPLHRRTPQPLQHRGDLDGGVPPRRRGHQLRCRLHKPHAPGLQVLPQALHADP